MHRIILGGLILMFTLAFSTDVQAQEDKSQRKSPPAKVEGTIGNATVTVDYAQVGVRGRTIWGDLVPYDKVWRTGANEATVFTASESILVDGNELPAGRYALFTIPGKEMWTVIFNSDADQWGAYSYDESKDVLRVDVKPVDLGRTQELMKVDILVKGNEGAVNLTWEKLVVSIPISI